MKHTMQSGRRGRGAAGPAGAGGFTLIEMMIAVSVVAITLAIALPSYKSSVRKSRRPEAKTALLDLASREERYFTVNNAYTNSAANLGYTAFPVNLTGTSSTPDYQLIAPTVTAATATAAATFTLQATAVNDQANDTCGSYTLSSTGAQTPATGTDGQPCW
jgi:type IV pilus assembly protein PilE